MYDNLDYTNSAELCEQMASECDTAIIAFSTGKDSIASWLQMRKYFKRIIPFYNYYIPNMAFIEDSLKYYEDFFGCHIYRLPHPSLLRWLTSAVFQPPYRLPVIAEKVAIDLDSYTDVTIGEIIRLGLDLPEYVYKGVGVRMADSPLRRIAIKQYGAINHNKKQFYPVYDWRKEDIINTLDESGVKLPVDYRVFGRTFDGLDYRFLKPLKEHFPDDYKLLLRYFPFAELEVARRDGFDTLRKSREELTE